MTVVTNVLLNFLQKELEIKDLYYVTERGWYYNTNIQFLGSFNECLNFLKMNENQYKEQLEKNKNNHNEGYWYSEIIPFDEILNECIKEINKINSQNTKLELCIRDITYSVKKLQKK